MSISPDVILSGKLGAILSTGATTQPDYGSVEIALCGYGPQVPKVAGEAILSLVTQDQDLSASTGNQFQVHLFSNNLVTPPGTYYTVTTKDANGDIVQTEAYYFEPGAWDLSLLVPYDPGQPPPPLPPLIISQLQIVGPSANPVFDGTYYTAFQITLPGDVTLATFQNMIPGNLYTFIIIQDGAGAHQFGWPANANNATAIDQSPYSTTTQTFVAIEGGVLYAIGAGTWR